MLADERLQIIAKIVQKNKFVDVKYLSEKLNISEKTIRLDLNKLQDMGILIRVYGGAQVNSEVEHFAAPSRNLDMIQEKKAIARKAYELINEGDIIFLDDGSTTLPLAELLGDKQITVMTSDICIAQTLSDKEKIDLYLIGGKIRKTSDTYITTGPENIKTITSYSFDKLFLGTTGIDPTYGLMIFYDDNRTYKRTLINASSKVICLADSSKFYKRAFSRFAQLDDLDIIITDKGVPKKAIDEMKDQKPELIIAE